MSIRVGCIEEETYPTVHNLSGSSSGGNTTITWEDPPDRFDRLNIALVRKLGSDPSSVTDGTSLGTVAIGTQTFTEADPASGTWHYAAFAAYDKSYTTPSSVTDYSEKKVVQVTI